MRRIIFISLIAVLSFAACKKELADTKKTLGFENAKSAVNAPGPCTGNTWNNDQVYKAAWIIRPLVYNNKAYIFDRSKNKLFTFDGTNWDSVSVSIPFNHYPTYAFTIGNKGYLGYKVHPIDNGYYTSYLWEYNFVTKIWSQKPPYPGAAHFGMAVFTAAGKGYLVGGGTYTGNANPETIKSTWEYNPKTSSWTQKANLPLIGISSATGFSIGDKGYVLNGAYSDGTSFGANIYQDHLYEYNPVTNMWSLKAPFPGGGQVETRSFVIGSVAYAGGGYNSVKSPNYYKYYPANNAWSQIANFPTTNLSQFSFSVNSKGYVVYSIAEFPYTRRIIKYTPSSCSGTSQ